jgi:hypothetical protein
MEVIRQIRIASEVRTLEKLNDVTLAAPDIDTEVFLQQLRVIGRLRSPITVLVSKEDGADGGNISDRRASGDRRRTYSRQAGSQRGSGRLRWRPPAWRIRLSRGSESAGICRANVTKNALVAD